MEPRPRAQAAPQPQPGASGQQAQPAVNPFAGTPHVRPLVEPSSSRRIPEIERQVSEYDLFFYSHDIVYIV